MGFSGISSQRWELRRWDTHLSSGPRVKLQLPYHVCNCSAHRRHRVSACLLCAVNQKINLTGVLKMHQYRAPLPASSPGGWKNPPATQ